MSLLCPVMALFLCVSILFVDKTVTVVALKEWFVRYGTIPAFSVIFRSIFSKVLCPSCRRSYQMSSVAGLNLPYGFCWSILLPARSCLTQRTLLHQLFSRGEASTSSVNVDFTKVDGDEEPDSLK